MGISMKDYPSTWLLCPKPYSFLIGLHSTSDNWPLCWSIYRCRVRLQDWLHSGDKFPIAFKVNYISEDLLSVTETSRLYVTNKLKVKL